MLQGLLQLKTPFKDACYNTLLATINHSDVRVKDDWLCCHHGTAEQCTECGRHTRGGITRNKLKINLLEHTQNSTSIRAKGVAGKWEGRRRTKGQRKTATTTTTTSKRGMPRNPSSPFPRRWRDRTPVLFLSYL